VVGEILTAAPSKVEANHLRGTCLVKLASPPTGSFRAFTVGGVVVHRNGDALPPELVEIVFINVDCCTSDAGESDLIEIATG
jgi:hypothetical protein